MILPPPDPSFAWQTVNRLPALVCTPLAEIAKHFFTTRQWMLGVRPVDEEPAWSQLRVAFAGDVRLVRMRQVHGSTAVVATTAGAIPVADIVIANEPEIAVAVQVADCVPLLLTDRRTGAVAAAHAGWRGLAANVPAAVLSAMHDRYGTHPADVVVAAGPSIGGCCYQVGVDVFDAMRAVAEDQSAMARWFTSEPLHLAGNPPFDGAPSTRTEGRWFFNGWNATRDLLVAAGVPNDAIFQSGLCTASHPDVFCSYRRDGAPAGRLAGVIGRARPALSADATGV